MPQADIRALARSACGIAVPVVAPDARLLIASSVPLTQGVLVRGYRRTAGEMPARKRDENVSTVKRACLIDDFVEDTRSIARDTRLRFAARRATSCGSSRRSLRRADVPGHDALATPVRRQVVSSSSLDCSARSADTGIWQRMK
jgi:hypothetical protein